jgi:hypothetical protein
MAPLNRKQETMPTQTTFPFRHTWAIELDGPGGSIVTCKGHDLATAWSHFLANTGHDPNIRPRATTIEPCRVGGGWDANATVYAIKAGELVL